jgi:hypothetical protein
MPERGRGAIALRARGRCCGDIGARTPRARRGTLVGCFADIGTMVNFLRRARAGRRLARALRSPVFFAAVSIRRTRSRCVSWLAIFAMVASALASPLAHAFAMRSADGMGRDLCTAAADGTQSQRPVSPSAPKDAGHHGHAGACSLCACSLAPAAAPPTSPAFYAGTRGEALPAPPVHATLLSQSPSEYGRPRAPPSPL